MTEAVSSFIDNIKQKSSNPFFGTLILVYLIRNWELVYTLFIFDKDCTMDDKKNYIFNYIHHTDNLNIFLNSLIAVGAYLLGILIITLSRFVVDWKDYRFTPWLNKAAVSNLVANKEDLDKMTKERDIFLDDLIKERERFSSVELDNRKLRDNITVSAKSYNELNKLYQDLLTNHHNRTNNMGLIELELKNLKDIAKERDALNDLKRNLITLKSLQIDEFINAANISSEIPSSIQYDLTELSKLKAIKFFRDVFEKLISGENKDEILFHTFTCNQLLSQGLIKKMDKENKYSNFNTYITVRGIHLYNFLVKNQVNG